MKKHHLATGVLLTILPLGMLVSCVSEPTPPQTVCDGLVPGWAAAEAVGTSKIQDIPRQVDFSSDPLVDCGIAYEDASGMAYTLAITLSTLDLQFARNRIPQQHDERPVVEHGQRVRIGIGRGTMSAKQAWVYTTCGGTEYAANVTVAGGATGNADAVRAIVASLLEALAEHKDCGPASGSPEPSSMTG